MGSAPTLQLSYHMGKHYNSVRPLSDLQKTDTESEQIEIAIDYALSIETFLNSELSIDKIPFEV